ncbi:flagellar export protein FliJ [Filobacillus milosensis]|uniref:Flagellar FliJ protein n=1 Tax=Filobacillus milosensis TaxID=94137 RepID=A0A4Y8IRI2_9BACI|nr:flagellar export protein FliJ [Filobacillus milosensis]TFB23212.1 flagellar export protein FliJ [Filobacillus milosensis]
MNPIISLEKLLDIKENDLNEAHSQYNRSIDHFEQIGEQLYDLLKFKESIEYQLNSMVKERIKASKLSLYSQQLENIKQKENELQMKVHQARLNMQQKENQLTLAHQEVKKLEKVINKRKAEQKNLYRKLENQFMDEISVQQYVRVNG